MSAIRKRYLGLVVGGGGSHTSNKVQVFAPGQRTCVGEIELADVEQVLNVYVVTKDQAQILLDLIEEPHA
jgi:hypothetical protein